MSSSFRAAAGVVMVSVLAMLTGGCRREARSYVTHERLQSGLVISLDGVGGYNWGPRWLRTGLDEAGVPAAIVIYDWSKGPKALFVGDLVDQNRNQACARDLAQMVATYVAAMPNRPVTLIGHSGGAAVVVWALEMMPPDCRVERAILLAPALAPDYDLSKALRAVRSRMYVMYSYADVGLMAAGTAVFGTMDRQHSVSAGLTGFRLPDSPADLDQYQKVRQVRWTFNLVRSGHLGGHMGWTTTRFAREFIAPILTGASDPGEPMLAVRAVTPASQGPEPAAAPNAPPPDASPGEAPAAPASSAPRGQSGRKTGLSRPARAGGPRSGSQGATS